METTRQKQVLRNVSSGRIQKESKHHMKAKAVAAGVEGLEQEVAESARTEPQLASAPSLEEIQQRAYELHLERGCAHGYDVDDWLQAERELKERHQSAST
jgi:hypothetical protein